MTKRKRSDSKKNIAKVAKTVLSNPLDSQRDIAKKAWVSKWTVYNKLGELGQTKDDRILWICDTDIKNVALWQAELQRRLQEQPKKLKTSEIVQIIAEWTKRYTIFKWPVTDKDWWLREIDLVD